MVITSFFWLVIIHRSDMATKPRRVLQCHRNRNAPRARAYIHRPCAFVMQIRFANFGITVFDDQEASTRRFAAGRMFQALNGHPQCADLGMNRQSRPCGSTHLVLDWLVITTVACSPCSPRHCLRRTSQRVTPGPAEPIATESPKHFRSVVKMHVAADKYSITAVGQSHFIENENYIGETAFGRADGLPPLCSPDPNMSKRAIEDP